MTTLTHKVIYHDFETGVFTIDGKKFNEEEVNKICALMPKATFHFIVFKDYSSKSVEIFIAPPWRCQKKAL